MLFYNAEKVNGAVLHCRRVNGTVLHCSESEQCCFTMQKR